MGPEFGYLSGMAAEVASALKSPHTLVAGLATFALSWMLGSGRRRWSATTPRARRRPPSWLRGRDDGVGLRLRAGAGMSAGLVLLTVVPGSWGWVLAATGAGVSFVLVGHLESSRHRVERETLARQLPTTLDLLAAALQAGAPVRRGAEQVAAVSPEPTATVLGLVGSQTAVGIPDEVAWRSLAAHRRYGGVWGPVAVDLARSVSSGVGVTAVVHTHAREARRRRHEALERSARTVGVRSVMPLMCCYLPAFIAVGVVPIIAGTVMNALGG